MEISEQVKQVFDVLAEKFDIVIDWGSQNAIPYLQDLMSRIVRYEIWTSILYMVICIFLFAGSAVLRRYSMKQYKLNDDEDWAVLAALCVAVMIGCFVIFCIQGFDIIKAFTIPEATIIAFVNGK